VALRISEGEEADFHRTAGERILFSSKMAGENRTIENLTRKNCLFLSTAPQNNHETLSPVYQWFVKSVFFVMGERGFSRDVTAKLCGASEYMVNVTKLVAAADLGIVDMRTQEKRNTLPNEFKVAFAGACPLCRPERRSGNFVFRDKPAHSARSSIWESEVGFPGRARVGRHTRLFIGTRTGGGHNQEWIVTLH
jgi:hypothetical protein